MCNTDMIADELIKLLSQQMFECFVNQLRLNNSESQQTQLHQLRVLRNAVI